MGRRDRQLLGYRFTRVDSFDLERKSSGTPRKFGPQKEYSKAKTTALNPYGTGSFCRLEVKGLPAAPGVYALTVDGDVVYVGQTQNLSERWGPRGFARISPRNCYVRGQSTNCKINGSVLKAAERNSQIDLWLHETSDPKPCEVKLICGLTPPWNTQMPDACRADPD